MTTVRELISEGVDTYLNKIVDCFLFGLLSEDTKALSELMADANDWDATPLYELSDEDKRTLTRIIVTLIVTGAEIHNPQTLARTMQQDKEALDMLVAGMHFRASVVYALVLIGYRLGKESRGS